MSDTNDAQEKQRPTIALMGEFSAGKTTLINFLLGADVLPTRVTATQLPPVWISYGERAAYFVDGEGNETPVEIEELATVGVEGVRYIRLFADSGVLAELDVIDTPGISDPNIPLHFRSFVAETADAILWCTHATQAWRESERSALDSMPKELLKHSVLLATRSDKLGVPERIRVRDRLIRETDGRFANIIMFSAVEAISACEQESEGELWAKSGGEELLKTLHHLSTAIADPYSERMELGMFAPAVPLEQVAQPPEAAGSLEDVLVLGTPAAAPTPARKPAAGGVVLPRRVRRKEVSRPLHKGEVTETPEVPAGAPVEEPVAEVNPEPIENAVEPARKDPVELTLVLTDNDAADAAPEELDEAEVQENLDTLELVEADLAPQEETVEEDEPPVAATEDPVEISEALIASIAGRVLDEPTDGAEEEVEPLEEAAPVAEEEAETTEEAPRTVVEAWEAYRDEHAPETVEDLDALVKSFLEQHTSAAVDDQSDTDEGREAGWRLYV
ncbi:dynamin family protein [Actibacterium pelagium]|uniref:dynamin family protein n=1 Tax=Actibacterium pelagium TaxID=2029103 RepID=UPI00130435E8|nr:dynamin family protein [Actibacterium pelagium]